MTLTPAETTHLELLERWRGAMDLIGPGPALPHLHDCASAVGWMTLQPGERWADLGSGAGFPGVALAARHPHARVHLVESRSKRAVFLERVVSAALPNATVEHTRSERLEPGAWDGVTGRAYKNPLNLLEQARGLLREGGLALLLVARWTPETVPGFELFHVEHYAVEGKPRAAVAYRRGAD